jgi:hypothetical protein
MQMVVRENENIASRRLDDLASTQEAHRTAPHHQKMKKTI